MYGFGLFLNFQEDPFIFHKYKKSFFANYAASEGQDKLMEQ
jgi:hypothetical protein